MKISLIIQGCRKGDCFPLTAQAMNWAKGVTLSYPQVPPMPAAGSSFYAGSGSSNTAAPCFLVCGHAWLPATRQRAARTPLLLALRDMDGQPVPQEFIIRKTGYAFAAITLSDKGALGQREDASGPLLEQLVGEHLRLAWSQSFLLPDDAMSLRGLLAELALEQGYDIICTSGGTGVGPRDVTPEATRPLLDRTLPGFSQAMLMASLAKTPKAVISRGYAGIIGKCLVINLPGSPRAVAECLEPVLPALDHTLAKLRGDNADCGG